MATMTVGSVLAWLLFAVNGGVGQRGVIHNPVRVHLLLQRMTLPRYMIVHPIFVKTTLQPVLHRVRTDKCMLSPFESWAMMGLLVGHMLVMGAAVVRK